MAAKILKDLTDFQKSWDRLEVAVKHAAGDSAAGQDLASGPKAVLLTAMIQLQRPMDALEKATKAVEKGK